MDDTETVRLRLDLAYDGTDFSGWAAQPGRRTVQGELEQALCRILRRNATPVTVAGRTDAGVHARGQVVHLDVPAAELERLDVATLPRRLGGVLPPDVRVHAAGVAPPGFDARFAALWRRYIYRVSDAVGGVDPLRRRDVLWHRRGLDVDRMCAAARLLLGEHDFAAYCRKRPGASTVRELQSLHWERDGDLLFGTVRADAFCHNMVRALVGALLAVGDGRRDVDWPRRVLAAGERDSAVHVVPAHGLTLEEVRYPGPEELASRVATTRRRRGPLPETPDGAGTPNAPRSDSGSGTMGA
ncbi:tRNA pseudouridine(38-40) synthase TruA [Lipingzhangella sp. LS1_29]|uniref:tRNA pseudouridine synthase A n=1 Tax=Lipingzhangella rawalii TaxID=2055835 RepID=A0ABU2H4K1_9ACTN|nr:tRNA pseudouridine(38-40) synthase TruA [Lipingzhangella rawalii]MDS1269927.1 tRNA pseudouridine(38-40) synthase TruA [Lipingzhangella rawalii]